ncbi:DinB family protein [Alicyclobacillus kakegawensis]|uniref:DinB family protein n=1 Tax=Alicyclobacillus kakegawensis TaxID=392012 RepID=UPI00082DE702|nr:DinB family protein [Alicyclobacillus kakegawensis]
MNDVQQFVQHWWSHRQVLPKLLQAIPDDKADFRPWDKAMSVTELVMHIASTAYKFVDGVANGRFEPGWEKPQAESLADARRILDEFTAKTRARLESLTPAHLANTVDGQAVFRFSAPGSVFLASALDHEIHHKGQLFVYARMAGAESVPFFSAR